MADYDLNEIADALESRFSGVAMFKVDGVDVPLNVVSEVEGQVVPPAMVIIFDDLDWDLTFARGSDAFTFVISVLLRSADSGGGQRILRTALSTGGVGTKIKDILEQDTTLGGLVSHAVMTGTRRIGVIQYSGLEYIGADIVIEMVAQ
jgi:hypothetical protein